VNHCITPWERGRERSPQLPWQEAKFRLWPAANCHHQKKHVESALAHK